MLPKLILLFCGITLIFVCYASETRSLNSAHHFWKSKQRLLPSSCGSYLGFERQAAPVGRLLFGPRRGLGATWSTKAAQRTRKGCVTCGFGAARCAEASPL